jgi:hypothetical protein
VALVSHGCHVRIIGDRKLQKCESRVVSVACCSHQIISQFCTSVCFRLFQPWRHGQNAPVALNGNSGHVYIVACSRVYSFQ